MGRDRPQYPAACPNCRSGAGGCDRRNMGTGNPRIRLVASVGGLALVGLLPVLRQAFVRPFAPATLGSAAVWLIAVGFAWRTVRAFAEDLDRIARRLDGDAEQLAGAAGQLAAANKSSAEGTGKQAASIEEASSSLEEISSMTQRNVEHARQANELAEEARAAADRGVNDLQAIGAAVEALNESSGQIANILKAIDGIAFQTNLLALNAAVEAARAGSAGAGFAIVADEVQKLASRSADAARETAVKIEDVVSWISQCEILKLEVASSLDHIATKSRQVVELAAQVAEASRQQAEGIKLVNSSVVQVSQVTQANAAGTEESAAAAAELETHSRSLRESLAELRALAARPAPLALPGN